MRLLLIYQDVHMSILTSNIQEALIQRRGATPSRYYSQNRT